MSIWSKFKNNLRLTGQGRSLSPEIILQLSAVPDKPDAIGSIEIHPEGYRSDNKVTIQTWPSPEQWQQIFSFFPFDNEIAFSKYYLNVYNAYHEATANDSQIGTIDIELKHIIQGAGYSQFKEKDIMFIAGCSKGFQDLRLQKNVPVKILKLLNESDQTHLLSLFTVLKNPQLKTNVVRKIVDLWIDLTEETQNNLLEKWNKFIYQSSVSQHSKDRNFSDQMFSIMKTYRYPEYSSIISEIEDLKSQLPGNVHVSYDKSLEEPTVIVSTRVDSDKSYEKFLLNIVNKENVNVINKLITLIVP